MSTRKTDRTLGKTKGSGTQSDSGWSKFLSDIDAARRAIGFNGYRNHLECYYRGHPDTSYLLQPSLFRDGKWKSLKAEAADEHYWQLEYDLFFEFQARARQIRGADVSSWDVLFWMQHYGLPTRLLDWTEVLGVAVYFALSGHDPKSGRTPAIWLLNPFRLNDLSWGDEDLVSPRYLGWDDGEEEFWTYEDLLLEKGMDWENPVAIYPELKSDRIHAQRGSFTIHGDAYGPLEEQFSKKESSKFLAKVELRPEAVAGARAFLHHAGIDQQLLFPELSGLTASLRTKYGLVHPSG